MILSAFCGTAGAVEFWEMEPIRYSETRATDTIAALAADLAAGTPLEWTHVGEA